MKSRPYDSPKRKSDAERTRKRLVAAASALLSRQPKSGGFSLDAVARKARVTRLTVYHQFGSRRALLEAVFDERAARGGLTHIAEAMGDPDPHKGLMRLIAIFCDFWGSSHSMIGGLIAVGTEDAELVESLRERNERRRRALSVLVDRMARNKTVPAPAKNDIVDVLFALTGFAFFEELRRGKRSPEDVSKLIQTIAGDLLQFQRLAP